MKPLPLHVPEVYQLCTRIVDAEGYVNVNRVRYSAPYPLIGRALEVRETLERVVLYERYRLLDLDRLERMVLRRIADDYFPLDLEAADE